MPLKYYTILLFVGSLIPPTSVFAITIQGYVREVKTLEPLIGATVFDSASIQSTVTNEFGYFRLEIPGSEKVVIRTRYLNYLPTVMVIDHPVKDSFVTLLMEPYKIGTVEITATKETANASVISIGKERILQTPVIGGISDLLRVLATFSGVTTGSELFTGLYVRGGNDDQNLHLLDGAPIYGTAHLFNLVSLYNSEAIKKVQLYKGLYPARFGGRLSSVLDVNFKEGNKEKWQGNFNIGILTSSMLLEGPLSKNRKTSLLFAARATYLNAFTAKQKKLINTDFRSVHEYFGYQFWDANLKINHEINNKNKVFLNVYYGDDHQQTITQNAAVFYRQYRNFADRGTHDQNLRNLSVCGRYSGILSDKIFTHFTYSYNTYKNDLIQGDKRYEALDSFFLGKILDPQYLQESLTVNRLFSGSNMSSRAEIMLTPDHHQIRMGMEWTRHQLNPGSFKVTQLIQDGTIDNQPSTLAVENEASTRSESALYVEDEFKIFKKLQINPGIRLSWFAPVHRPRTELRLLADYNLSKKIQLSFGFGTTNQYLFTLNTSANLFDRNIWVASDRDFKPQQAQIYTLGTQINHLPLGSSLSVQAYYRKMNNLLFYRFNSEDNLTYYNWQNKAFKSGQGKVYGVDMDYVLPVHRGWSVTAGYTFSWNYRRFEEINKGQWFFSRYDRRHDFKLTLIYAPPASKWSGSALWFYNTGNRFTLPTGYTGNNALFPNFPTYNNINNVKMPAFHRLDLMAKRTYPCKKGFIKSYSYIFNVVNVYNQKNPYSLYFDTVKKEDTQGNVVLKKQLKGKSALTTLPSVNFNVTF